MQFTLNDIAEICGGELRGDGSVLVREIATDSRLAVGPGSLFFALPGPRFDGHNYLDDIVANGAAAVVQSAPSTGNVVVVPDTLSALQALAAHWRAAFKGKVVGITGSNGKTVVKEMLAAILSRRFNVHRSPGSFNSQIGVPLSLLGIRHEHQIAIIEAGISQRGEMPQLAAMIQPDMGIITTIGNAHSQGLGSLKDTAYEKSLLFADTPGTVVVAKDVPKFGVALPNIVTVGDGADVTAADLTVMPGGFQFTAVLRNQRVHIRLNVPGEHNVHNALCAAAAALELGATAQDVQDGLASFELAPMRLEMHTTSSGVTLINDAYSSDPVSAQAALGALHYYAGGARTVAVLGDMLELGESAERLHNELGAAVQHHHIDTLVAYGDNAAWIAAGAADMAKAQVHCVADMDALSELLDDLLQPGDFVLFKGSRQLGLERAASALFESMAPTRLQINLDAIRHNVHVLREQLGPDVKLMAVVKSFAYGNDATRVSQTLIREGVDALAVAYPDEAIPLRKRGMNIPILVTNALAEEADKVLKYNLTPIVYSKRVVDALSHQAAKHGASVDVHIEVDTGMHRVGIPPGEVLEFARWVRDASGIRVTGLMTHFASADDPQQDEFTRRQILVFDALIDTMKRDGFELNTIHAANTAAAWRFPEARYDMVRVGLGLYGYHPSKAIEAIARETQAALRFRTQVVHVKNVSKGDTVSYGRKWTADQERVIATIAAGYNDGLPRFMSNGGLVLIHGKPCPIVGSVCMDVSMVDVSDVPGVVEGDEVVIFGKQGDAELTVDAIAERGGTINYEILCKISPRVRRLFLREI